MELTATALQTVAQNQNVLYTDVVVCGSCSMAYRIGSGLVSLKGLTNQCRALYKVTFGANIAIPAAGAVAPISLAIAIDGEPLLSTNMIETPAAVSQFNNVSGSVFLAVPKGCCS